MPVQCCLNSVGLTHLVEPFDCQRLQSNSNILIRASRDSQNIFVPFFMNVLVLEMGSLRALFLVDDSRVGMADASEEVQYILGEILSAPVLVAERRVNCDRMLPEIFTVLCDTMGGCESTLSSSEQNWQHERNTVSPCNVMRDVICGR